MSLAFLLSQKVTPMKLWEQPNDPEWTPRKSSETRKLKLKAKIECCYNILTKPMTVNQCAIALQTEYPEQNFKRDSVYDYLHDMWEEGRIQRSGKQPYVYWKL